MLGVKKAILTNKNKISVTGKKLPEDLSKFHPNIYRKSIGHSRQLEAIILELAIGTIKIESGACDLPPEGSNKQKVVARVAI